MNRNLNSSEEQEIRGFLRKLQKRLAIQRSLWYLALYGLIGAGFALLCNLLSLWIPIYAGEWIGFAGFGGILLLGVIHWLCHLPREREAALMGDRAGMEERLTTNLEIRDRSDLMSRLQQQDTAERLRSFSISERLPLRIYSRWYTGAGICLAIALICALYPTAAKQLAAERHALKVVKKEAVKQLDRVDKKLEEQAGEGKLKESEQKKLKEILRMAEKEIKTSKEQGDIRKAQERLETKLVNSLPKSLDDKTAENLQSLVQNQDLKAMAEYQQALDQLAENSETIAAAKQALQSLGELLGTEQKQALIRQLNQAMSDGNVSQTELEEALQSLQDANASYTQTKLSQADDTPSSSAAQANSSGQASAGGQSGEEKGQDSGAENGSGSGNGNILGNGSGSGVSNGNGSGSSAGSGGGYSSGSEQGIQRKDPAREAEQVWIPEETGEDENLTGQKQGSSSTRRKSDHAGTSRAGTKSDLSAVSGQYEKKAYSKIQKQKIPDSMEDLVKEYFSSLD